MTTTLSSQTPETTSYAWAEHLIWMEGGEPVPTTARERVWPGLLLALVSAACAVSLGWVLSRSGFAQARLLDPIFLSMLLGLGVGNALRGEFWLPGISMAVRQILPLGIVLLGVRMDLSEALRIGVPGLGMSVGVVLFSLGCMLWFGRLIGLDRKMALLLGVGTGICGGTAIVALAPLIRARDRDVIVAVGLVTLVGLALMLVLPFLAEELGFSARQAGLLAGLTIHQTPQAIAAGFAVGEEAGGVATVAKLSRVCLLAPMAVLLGWWMVRRERSREKARISWYRWIPGFAVGFFLVALARTLGFFPDVSLAWGATSVRFESSEVLKSFSHFCLAVGMVGVGFQTRFSQARTVGWRPVFAAFLTSLLITAIAVAMIWSFFSNET